MADSKIAGNNLMKSRLWAASKLAYSIVDGKLPVDYKTRMDYKFGDIEDNCYQRAGFLGEVYSFSGGIEKINAGLVGTSSSGIIISFRGTNGNDSEFGSFLDWLNNFLAVPVSFAPYGNGNVHMGFFNSVLSIQDSVIAKTLELVSETKNNTPTDIYITGHSKGGAMAAIMAKILEKYVNNKIIVYTFGAPRAGDDAFRKEYSITHYRYESFLDIVSHLSFSKQELELIPRMGILYEILAPLLVFPAYASVGTGICIYKPKGIYGKLPWYTDNNSEEILNSFCAVEQVIRGGDYEIFYNTHAFDYY
ncbi:lipase family protein [Anaerocolumna sp. MB42-C2]|uniref:lipase family protein n=1 Tax=Anaerocolumna sp. MB42-C2 TaxID=3070997 RepID=UPI0027E039D4|nr:lipase family protein [Anaerocolumna sp. MB42-C2]WMJ88973.1 lipase family protein [Anaerocolumna sp. MB42-C2]